MIREEILTDDESRMHMQLLLENRGACPATKEQIAAEEMCARGLHYDGRMWVAFDNSGEDFLRVRRFKKKSQAIDWLYFSPKRIGGLK